MPIHDWARVDANLCHDFHQAWTIGICNALNGGLLPRNFSALVEPHAIEAVSDSQQAILAARGNRITLRHALNRSPWPPTSRAAAPCPTNRPSRMASTRSIESGYRPPRIALG